MLLKEGISSMPGTFRKILAGILHSAFGQGCLPVQLLVDAIRLILGKGPVVHDQSQLNPSWSGS